MRVDEPPDGEQPTSDTADRLLDTTPIVAVPALLVVVYVLPTGLQRKLVFEYGTPTLVTAYTAHFVHFSPRHLTGNLLAFVLVTGTIYALSVRADRRRLFSAFIATLFIAFPVTLSALNLAVPRNGVTYGFSGLNMALAGFLPIVIATFIERRLGHPVNGVALLFTFFASVGYIATNTVPLLRRSSGLAMIAVVSLTAIMTSYRTGWDEIPAPSERSWQSGEIREHLICGFSIWALLLVLGFPNRIVTNGTVTNVYVHFLGYALGFTTAYIAYEWQLVGKRPALGTVSTAGQDAGRK